MTGFTSLSQVVETFGIDLPDEKTVCILFGVEPQVKRRKRWKEVPLSQEVKDYWIEKGISPFLGGAVIKTIENIKSGRLSFRTLDALHAKLYVTEQYATLGSSNFSHSGLTIQYEANIRYANNSEAFQNDQYTAIRSIARYYWQQGKEHSNEVIGLLEQLLLVVDWKEALARAVAELLDGEYVKAYLDYFTRADIRRLWPSQLMGIHQGLHILQEMGSLLVADPTGSGKTKMITVLELALINWLWETGRGLKINSAVIAPPIVIRNWKEEQFALGWLLPEPISQGILSWPHAYNYKPAIESLRLANLLVLDEAHNYLNKKSARSFSVSSHSAEFVILSTATPINKRAEDLLRLVQLLDPDNLGDTELREFKVLYSMPSRNLEEDDAIIQQLKSYIWKFTLRRTKSDLNHLIRKEPEKYLNELGKECRYPEQVHHFYKTGEIREDIRIAQSIEKLSADLKGLIYLRTIAFPYWRSPDTKEKREGYIQARLKTVKGLSRYRVQASMRSSRAALIEMIEGTRAAEQFAGITVNKKTGAVIETLEEMKGQLPKYPKEWDVLPAWLTNKVLFEKACEEEIAIYRKIAALARSLSDSREVTKANTLVAIMQRQSVVIAFDHTIISLFCIQKILKTNGVQCYVVSGVNTSTKQSVLEHLRLGSEAKNLIVLCSDAVSEGVNLQAAPAVVMLDMPSVLRLAEQRIGRIDRLNSPHKKIHIYWPEDSPAFQLKADRNLIRTASITRQLMGSNLHLPEAQFLARYDDLSPMAATIIVEELKSSRTEQEQEWAGMKDAFEDVRLLVEGSNALLSETEYSRMLGSNATVRCKLSFVQSAQHWAFIALRSSKESVSRWLFVDEKEDVFTDFAIICRMLRERLTGCENVPFNEVELRHFVQVFRQKEREVLPPKKRRALQVAESILKRQQKECVKSGNKRLAVVITEALELFRQGNKEVAVDYYRFSMLWLEILSGWLKDLRERKKTYKRWLSLEDLTTKLGKGYGFTEAQLAGIISHVPLSDPLELQIAACIIGVGAHGN